jgi:ParB-like nuclease domain
MSFKLVFEDFQMKKNVSNDFQIKVPEGCNHLYGTLFTVPFSIIRVPEASSDDNIDYRFENPRVLTEKGTSDLLDKKLSSDLRESIKTHTLLNPLVCRWVKDGEEYYPLLVGGDRRYRALDFLIRKKEIVSDPRRVEMNEKGEWVYEQCSAENAYSYVPCQIFAVNDDLEALALAWAENKNRINLTDGHEIAEVIKLRKYNAGDQCIIDILQRDEKWLKETDQLILSLDTETLADLLESRIDRSSAIELSNIEDVELRNKIRISANESSQKSADRKIKKIQKQIESALEEKDVADAEFLNVCSFSDEESEDQDSINQAKFSATEAEKKVKRIIKEKDKIKPVTTTKDLKKAVSDFENDNIDKKLSPKKVAALGLEYIETLIRDEGICVENNFKIDIQPLYLVKNILNNIVGRNTDFAQSIQDYLDFDCSYCKK